MSNTRPGFIVFMAHTNESVSRQQAVLTAMREQGAAGIALCPVLATDHLISKGHKRIGFVGGETGIVMDQRLNGYKQSLADAGIAFDERLIFRTRPTREGGHAAMTALLGTKPKVRAAVCYNDLVAFGALSALGERGMKAGGDFALMGFDNVLAAAHSNPPLSTIDVRPSELGEHAAAILLSRIEEPGRPVERYLGKPELLLRQST
ncbi:MAG: substrate-binding domain-containing protein [Pseudomonadota bacterium]|nr:substrate-binding domain-containing protein [Pseudomonadota bacterium]